MAISDKQKATKWAKFMSAFIAIEKMVEMGAAKFEFSKGNAYIFKEIQWDGKDEVWRKNMARNLKAYMDYSLAKKFGDKARFNNFIRIWDLESDELLFDAKV